GRGGLDGAVAARRPIPTGDPAAGHLAATGRPAPADEPAAPAEELAAVAEELAAAAGEAAAHLLRLGDGDGRVRWVSWATVTGPAHVALLAAMFPAATIPWTLRHPVAAAESLATRACGDGAYAARPAGHKLWRDGTDALAAAAEAYPDRFERVDVTDMVADPEDVLGACLHRVGLGWDPLCGAVVDGVTADRELVAAAGAAPTVAERAATVARYRQLRVAPGPATAGPASREVRADALVDALADARRRAAGPPPGTGGAEAWGFAARYRAFASLAVPAGATVAVVSKGDPVLVDLPGRRCVHLPGDADGRYLGHHPADGAEAVGALERAAAAGAGYLLVPGPSGWWLDHYDGFAAHLSVRARVVALHEDLGTVYELDTTSAPGQAPPTLEHRP
ncbi:MAG TPA: sulfotransferase, partial [Acidimicrobiales bacterium]|nr:sulfotransferase [Acidimicrobiales bacterium]